MTKKCRICKTPFEPSRPMQPVCNNDDCRYTYAKQQADKSRLKREKKQREQDRQKMEEMQPKSYWWKRAKKAFHAWVRARDEGKECISCETILVKLGRVGGDYDAGHRRSVGSAKHLEFDERNVHGQCKHCNDYLKGNPDSYNAKLPSRIGQEAFDALMSDEDPRNLRAEDYKEIEQAYKRKLKELQCKS